jgi:hypothetical protein
LYEIGVSIVIAASVLTAGFVMGLLFAFIPNKNRPYYERLQITTYISTCVFSIIFCFVFGFIFYLIKS